MGFKNHIRHTDTLQQQSPDVQRSNPCWVLKTVEPNLTNETCPTSLALLQPAQCPIEMWGIFMPHLYHLLSVPRATQLHYTDSLHSP
jgi:hypothetical protein